ncbi:MAG: hypothetical protein ACOC5U_01475 [Candidatus Aminicenantaceae bacterium]
MFKERKTAFHIILFIFIFALGASLFLNIRGLRQNFLFADEATYYMLTQSIAQDGDLEYTRRDLIRYYQSFDAGPLGLFLKKGKDGKIYFAKSFAHSLFSAPFVKFLGANGIMVFHTLLFFVLLFLGYLYFTLANSPLLSLATVLTFFFASVAMVYFLWLSPDFFNLFLIFTVLFLWLYKHKAEQHRHPEPGAPSWLHHFLLSPWSDILAAALAAIAVFSKPPNVVVMGPLVLHCLLKKKWLRAGSVVLVFLTVSALLWGSNYVITGDWNYQGGNRKTFYGHGGYPLEKDHLTFEEAQGGIMTSEGYAERHLYPPRVFVRNIFYYFFGRFTGLTWYYFPAVLALLLFFMRRKSSYQWMILAALSAEILIYIVLMPDNYNGGGGALANRYFLCIYPFFLFLPGLKRSPREVGVSWAAASFFIAQILISPMQHSRFPATHAKTFPFNLLPVELTLVNNLPTNTNPAAHRQPVGIEHTWLYFLDDNFIPRTSSVQEKRGFYTRGPHKAEMIMKTFYPIEKITFRLLNNPRRSNTITVHFAGETKKITLGSLQRGSLSFSPRRVFQKNQWIHLYRLTVQAEKGSIPHFEQELSEEKRYLGVFFEVDIVPEYWPE